MIPQRTLRNELAGNELRNRVTACRKRLRTNRFVQKSCTNREGPEATFPDAESAMRESFLSANSNSAALGDNGDRAELSLAVETRGVGIT